MPHVLNVRHLSGFGEKQPVIPPGAVYIGRPNRRYGLARSKWANPFRPSRHGDPAEHELVVATYERWLRAQPKLMASLPQLCGLDLVCWCAPLPCHGDVLLRLANEPTKLPKAGQTKDGVEEAAG